MSRKTPSPRPPRDDENEENQHDDQACDIDNRNRWQTRRKMAWLAMISMLVVTLFVLFVVPLERLSVIEEIVTWFFFSMATIVMAYFGFTTWAYKGSKNNRYDKYD